MVVCLQVIKLIPPLLATVLPQPNLSFSDWPSVYLLLLLLFYVSSIEIHLQIRLLLAIKMTISYGLIKAWVVYFLQVAWVMEGSFGHVILATLFKSRLVWHF